MDEMDASLDTRTVFRVGRILREKAHALNTQFIIVSHRPELQAIATRLVGLYQCHGRPTALTLHFDTAADDDQEKLEGWR